MAKGQTDLAAKIVKYLEENKILLVDRSSSGRAATAKVLVEMGAKTYNILLAGSYAAAESEMKAHLPRLIISDYRLNEKNILALVNGYKLDPVMNRECILILVTSNALESSIAEAAEEDVDAYLVKPIAGPALKKYLVAAIVRKLQPTSFMELIYKGKAAALEKNYDTALATFLEASLLPENPSLAFSLAGQIEVARRQWDKAEKYFAQGLEKKKAHFKCLSGIFDIYVSQKKFAEAFEIGTQLAEEFPLSSARLESMLHLVVHNRNFDHVFDFYERYEALDTKSASLDKCMAAVLVLTGKSFCTRNQVANAKLAFERSLLVSNKNIAIFREVIVSLVENKMLEEASYFLNHFQINGEAGSKEDTLLRTLRFLISNQTETVSQVIEYGRKLIAEEVFDPMIFEVMIQRANEAKLKAYAETLVFDAIRRWPELKHRFQS